MAFPCRRSCSAPAAASMAALASMGCAVGFCRGDGAWAFVRGGGVEAETDSVSSSGTESIRQSGLLHAFGSGRGLQRRFGGNRGNFTGGDRRIKGRKQSQLLPGFLLEHMQG